MTKRSKITVINPFNFRLMWALGVHAPTQNFEDNFVTGIRNEQWSTGSSEDRNIGTLEQRNTKTPEQRKTEISEHRNTGNSQLGDGSLRAQNMWHVNESESWLNSRTKLLRVSWATLRRVLTCALLDWQSIRTKPTRRGAGAPSLGTKRKGKKTSVLK